MIKIEVEAISTVIAVLIENWFPRDVAKSKRRLYANIKDEEVWTGKEFEDPVTSKKMFE